MNTPPRKAKDEIPSSSKEGKVESKQDQTKHSRALKQKQAQGFRDKFNTLLSRISDPAGQMSRQGSSKRFKNAMKASENSSTLKKPKKPLKRYEKYKPPPSILMKGKSEMSSKRILKAFIGGQNTKKSQGKQKSGQKKNRVFWSLMGLKELV